jgi:hypothetical protein
LFVVSGDNENGVTHAPGFGKLVAELVAERQPRLTTTTPFRLDRFGDRYSPQNAATIVSDLISFRTGSREENNN